MVISSSAAGRAPSSSLMMLLVLAILPLLFNNQHLRRGGVHANSEIQPPKHPANNKSNASRIKNVALLNGKNNNGSRIRNGGATIELNQQPPETPGASPSISKKDTIADYLQDLITARKRRRHRFLPALRLNQLLRLFVLERGRNRNGSGGENGDGGDADVTMPMRSKKKMYFTCFAIVSAWSVFLRILYPLMCALDLLGSFVVFAPKVGCSACFFIGRPMHKETREGQNKYCTRRYEV